VRRSADLLFETKGAWGACVFHVERPSLTGGFGPALAAPDAGPSWYWSSWPRDVFHVERPALASGLNPVVAAPDARERVSVFHVERPSAGPGS
jgi:hypothetical protein